MNYGKSTGHKMPFKTFFTVVTIQWVTLGCICVFRHCVCNCCRILTKILNVSTRSSEMPQNPIPRKFIQQFWDCCIEWHCKVNGHIVSSRMQDEEIFLIYQLKTGVTWYLLIWLNKSCIGIFTKTEECEWGVISYVGKCDISGFYCKHIKNTAKSEFLAGYWWEYKFSGIWWCVGW